MPKTKVQQVISRDSNAYKFPRNNSSNVSNGSSKNLDDSKDTKSMTNIGYDSLSEQMFDIELSMLY